MTAATVPPARGDSRVIRYAHEWLRPAAVCVAAVCGAILAGCDSSSRSSGVRAALRINEVMARNSSTVLRDDSGRPIVQDWVELYNDGPEPLTLQGYSLTDNPRRRGRFRFPPGAEIAPGEFVVVFVFNRDRCEERCDDRLATCLTPRPGEDEPSQDDIAECERAYDTCLESCEPVGFIADFGLGGSERMYLYDGDALVDQVGVTEIPPDVSVGRFPDGSGGFEVIYAGPTPGTGNRPAGVPPPAISASLSPEALIPDCGEDVTLSFSVSVETADVEAVDVVVELADVAQCGDLVSDEDFALAVEPEFVEAVTGEPFEVPDLNNELRTVEPTVFTYSATLPGSPCGTTRRARIRARADEVETVERLGCFTWAEDQSLAPVRINEYVPRNTELVFTYQRARFIRAGQMDPDPPTPASDWFELVNYGDAPIDISRFGIASLNDWEEFLSGQVDVLDTWTLVDPDPLSEETPEQVIIDPGCFLVVLADNDGGSDADQFRQTYRLFDPEMFRGDLGCQLTDSSGDPYFFSTDFGLDATTQNRIDGFVFVDENGRRLDAVELAFESIPPDLVDETGAVPTVRANVALGRLPLADETFSEDLVPGEFLCVPTPGADNTLLCDVPPRFDPDVLVLPRNPRAGEPVAVSGKVNFDLDTTSVDQRFEVHYRVERAGGGASDEVLTLADDALVLEESADQTDAAAASRLYDFVATFPGFESGDFVTFFCFAQDLSDGGDNSEVFFTEDDTPRSSMRFVVGFEPPADHPRITEVLPLNQTIVLPPFVDVPMPPTPDYAEIHNPSGEAWDLSGYYLAQVDPTSERRSVLSRPREWRFPDGTLLPAGESLPLYFGGVGEEFLEVDFNLGCPESLFLIAPDDAARGAHSVIDSVAWGLNLCNDLPDRSWARPCESFDTFAVVDPSPAELNSAAWLPPLFHSAYHTDVQNVAALCVSPTSFVTLNAHVFVDAALAASLESQRSEDVIDSAVFVVDYRDGSDPRLIPASRLDVTCPAAGDCVEAPEGYRSVRLSTLLDDLSQRSIGASIEYEILATTACGRMVAGGPFSVGTSAGDKPAVVINEINLAAPLPGAPDEPRAWVELLNLEGGEVDASGMFLTDDLQVSQKVVVPDGTTLSAGGFAVVPIDGASGMDLTGRDGELVLIDSVARGSCGVDSFAFDYREREPSTSLGLLPDGMGDPVELERPSPGAPNDSSAPVFLRGDADEDGRLTVSDMIRILSILFDDDAERPACDDALDADDDGRIAVNDSLFIGNFLFQDGDPIPPPYPEPGPDPTPDDLECRP